ncbi:MAG: cobalamin-dependent protein [Deltaproteobacteria bacterium]|nr:cobalamin-dependent protein [Deltaproteobacteria bacterium]
MPSLPRADLDCLFVHVPKAANHYLPLGDFFNVTYMPMGLPALADWANRAGFRTEILHLGVEWIRDPGFDLLRWIDGRRIRAFGLPLYWHYQTYDVVETARQLKAHAPDAFVFLGGLTAGYFAEQILAMVPEVDAILQGPAEGAIVPLLESLRRGDRTAPCDAWVRGEDGEIRRTPRARLARPSTSWCTRTSTCCVAQTPTPSCSGSALVLDRARRHGKPRPPLRRSRKVPALHRARLSVELHVLRWQP